MKRFEYTVIRMAVPLHRLTDAEAASLLNSVGAAGWQVVGIEQTFGGVVWLMRELSPAGNPL